MADDSEKKRLVRFDFPRGLDAAAIAKAIREHGRRILEEAAEKKAAEGNVGQPQSKPRAEHDAAQTEGRLGGEPEAET